MSEREKQKPEEKVKIVIKYIAGEVSISGAATEAGVDRKTLQRWVMQYEAEGAAAFLPGRREHIYSPKLKLQAVQEYLSGMGSQAELSKKYGLRDRRQLRNWLKVYNAHGDFNSRKNSGGGSYMKQGRDTTQEERIRIVKDCLASGKNYTNRTFHHKLMQAGMTQSMSRVAHCIDNGPMEGFWGILKREHYYGRRFTSKRELVQMIETYVHYYNTRRVQRNLGVLTPMEKYERCLAA